MELQENYGLLKKILKLFVHGLAQAVLKFFLFLVVFFGSQDCEGCCGTQSPWLGAACPGTPALRTRLPRPAVSLRFARLVMGSPRKGACWPSVALRQQRLRGHTLRGGRILAYSSPR